MSVKIYHNPRCSKSRQSLALLTDRGIDPEIIEYLKTPPSVEELKLIIKSLNTEPLAIMRTNEADYKAARAEIEDMHPNDQLTWLAAHPRALQRPIVISPAGARIGRPPETILDIV